MIKFSKIDLAVLLFRLVFGFRLIYGTVDNVFSWNRMLEFKEFPVIRYPMFTSFL
ncbi:MAG: hypothetical protein R2824_04210 [Saprospiraceae bacterium]|nr:hypothetical protein [Lewinella sp.]